MNNFSRFISNEIPFQKPAGISRIKSDFFLDSAEKAGNQKNSSKKLQIIRNTLKQ